MPSPLSAPGRFAHGILFGTLLVTLAGCGRDDVKVYQVAKDDSPSQPPAGEIAPPAQNNLPVKNQSSQPQLQFALPPGWQQVPATQMRVASFAVTNASGPSADVGVIPLPTGEDMLALINMWRDQVQLPHTTDANFDTVPAGGDTAKLFEFISTVPMIDGKYRQRIIVAMLNRGTTSWFFKLTGEDSFVASQKDVFLKFLKSVSFADDVLPSAPFAAAPAMPNDNTGSIWTVPPGWQSLPPSQFLLAQFSVQDGDSRAEINVSRLAGEGGGLVMNVNRWRRQLGLPPVAQEDDFSKMVDSLAVPGGQAELVDISGTSAKTGQSARLIGVVLPQTGQTWFYKLMGDPKVVAAQKDAFLKFIQSARYPDAR